MGSYLPTYIYGKDGRSERSWNIFMGHGLVILLRIIDCSDIFVRLLMKVAFPCILRSVQKDIGNFSVALHVVTIFSSR
ncbi:MAG: hypothetical protein LBB16_01570 [Puniceicoccales bacterium]|nr:hypothetical protein [Puniceicoccales bacterium]